MRKKTFGISLCIAIACILTLFAACGKKGEDLVKKEAIVEVGTPITLEAFFDKVPSDAQFLTDVTGIDTSVPAIYQLRIAYDKYEVDVICRLEDHTGPTAEAVPMTVYNNWKMPEASECVTSVFDISGVASIEYQDGIPQFAAAGEYEVAVVLTDVYGNASIINVPFTVVVDKNPPVITGAHDLELSGNPDDLDFFEGITVKDDIDPNPILRLDDSLVDYSKNGTYDIIYKAVDKAGNIGTAKAKLTISMPVEEKSSSSGGDNGTYHVGDGDPYGMAANIVSGLRRGSDVETARAIFNWVHDTLWFKLLWGTPNFEDAAYRGFTKHSGDCYVYYACCKMLLDAAGIENMRVDRSPRYNGNVHFWLLVKLNGEWYHCDATEGYSDHPGVWFMCTDAQINDRYHQFNGSLYPERAGGSKDFKASPTPTPSVTLTPSVSVTPTGGVPSVSVTPTPTTANAPTSTPTPMPDPVQPDPTATPTPEPTPIPEPPKEDPTPVPDPVDPDPNNGDPNAPDPGTEN